MLTDNDYVRAARSLIDLYGRGALAHARRRADELRHEGEASWEIWAKLAETVARLQDSEGR